MQTSHSNFILLLDDLKYNGRENTIFPCMEIALSDVTAMTLLIFKTIRRKWLLVAGGWPMENGLSPGCQHSYSVTKIEQTGKGYVTAFKDRSLTHLCPLSVSIPPPLFLSCCLSVCLSVLQPCLRSCRAWTYSLLSCTSESG